MPRHGLSLVAVLVLLTVAASAQKGHSDDVITELPMPELFLQPVKYVAHTGTTVVHVRTEQQYCEDGQGNPLSPCLIVPYSMDPSPTWATVDLFTVVIPRKTLREVFSAVPRFGPDFTLRNFTPESRRGLFRARLTLTLESPALPDGSVVTTFGDRRVAMWMPPDGMFADMIHYTRHGMVGRPWLKSNLGMTDEQVDAFFDSDITVRVGVRVVGALLSHGSIYVGVLFQGY